MNFAGGPRPAPLSISVHVYFVYQHIFMTKTSKYFYTIKSIAVEAEFLMGLKINSLTCDFKSLCGDIISYIKYNHINENHVKTSWHFIPPRKFLLLQHRRVKHHFSKKNLTQHIILFLLSLNIWYMFKWNQEKGLMYICITLHNLKISIYHDKKNYTLPKLWNCVTDGKNWTCCKMDTKNSFSFPFFYTGPLLP